MSRPPSRTALYLALFVLGVHAQVAQALLIRESLVVFYGNELSLGAFFGSWLLWVAVGSLAALPWRARGLAALDALRVVLLLLPWLLAAQVVLLRSMRWVIGGAAGELVPLDQLLAGTLVANLPSALGLGLAFPLAVLALRALAADPAGAELRGAVHAASRLYALDALGALAGGVLFTFVLVDLVGVWRTTALGLIALGLALLGLANGRTGWRLAAAATAAAGLVLAAPGPADRIESGLERWRFQALQPGLELIDSVETRYGHVALARRGGQYSVLTDGRLEADFPDRAAAAQLAAYLHAQADAPQRVLLFGGVASGLAAELLRYPIDRAVAVVTDERAFQSLRPFLPEETQAALRDPRLSLRFGDGRRYANALARDEAFDLVVVFTGDPASAQSNRYYTFDFYRALARGMAPGGVLCTAVGGASNYLGREVRGYGASVLRTLREVWPEVALMPGDEQLFCAARHSDRVTEDASVLERRYLATPLEDRRFPGLGFHSMLPPDRVALLHAQLSDPPGELNTDERPVTYWLNMLLWGKFTASALVSGLERVRAMGPLTYLIPPVAFVALLLLRVGLEGPPRPQLRRQAAMLALAALGFVAMAAQLALLFSYQSRVGFVFSRVALLNGLFMTGLALGSGLLGPIGSRRAGAALAAVLSLTAGGLYVLPLVLGRLAVLEGTPLELAYLALCLWLGLLTGAGFPLGVERAQRDTASALKSSGLAEAADSLGGAAGGLLTGALLVPTLGVTDTCRLLAALTALGLPLLLWAEYGPGRVGWLAARGHRAFRWTSAGWFLTFLVVCGFGWSLLARGAAPGPQLRFDTERVAALSGSAATELRVEPFVHYLGTDAEGLRVVTLASIQVAADVHGYGGPLNLLVALDETGRLRGTRHVESRETPSYVADIDTWLATLTGRELRDAPLTLEQVDALTGATVTSRAALESINRVAREAGGALFGQRFGGAATPAPPAWQQPAFLATLALLAAFYPIYRWGRDRPPRR